MSGQDEDVLVQRALLEKLARWRHLPEGDLITMLGPVERLRFRPETLAEMEWSGLVSTRQSADERIVSITEAGDAWLHQAGQLNREAHS